MNGFRLTCRPSSSSSWKKPYSSPKSYNKSITSWRDKYQGSPAAKCLSKSDSSQSYFLMIFMFVPCSSIFCEELMRKQLQNGKPIESCLFQATLNEVSTFFRYFHILREPELVLHDSMEVLKGVYFKGGHPTKTLVSQDSNRPYVNFWIVQVFCYQFGRVVKRTSGNSIPEVILDATVYSPAEVYYLGNSLYKQNYTKVIMIFSGLRSRWMILFECSYLSA